MEIDIIEFAKVVSAVAVIIGGTSTRLRTGNSLVVKNMEMTESKIGEF